MHWQGPFHCDSMHAILCNIESHGHPQSNRPRSDCNTSVYSCSLIILTLRLRVVMAMCVDETGRNDTICGVDRSFCVAAQLANSRYPAISHADVAEKSGSA